MNRFLVHARRHVGRLGRRQWISLGVVVLVVATLATVFHPGVQKRAIMRFVAPQVDFLALERVHVLPWSVTVEGLQLQHYGGSFSAAAVSLRYCVSALLGGTVRINRLKLVDGYADVRSFALPPSPPSSPFIGVFPTLDFGFGLALGEVVLDATAVLNDTDHARVSLRGGGIAPDETGEVGLVGHFESGPATAINLEGTLTVDQLKDGLYKGLALDLRTTAMLPDLPQPEQFRLLLELSPEANPPVRETTGADGEIVLQPLPERVSLSVVQQDRDRAERATLSLEASYDGAHGRLGGNYRLRSNEKIVARYLGETPLPRFLQSGRGEFDLTLEQLSGRLTLHSETTLSELQALLGHGPGVPGRFGVDQSVALSFEREQLQLETLRTRVTDEDGRTVVDAVMPARLEVDLARPESFMAQARSLLTVNVGGILLTWFDALLPDYDIVGGTFDGEFAVGTDADGTLELTPVDPFTISGVRIEQGGEAIVENLDLTLRPTVRRDAAQTVVTVSDIGAQFGDTPVANAMLTLGVPIVTDDGADGSSAAPPLALDFSGAVFVDPLLAQPAVAALIADKPLPPGLTLQVEGAATAAAASTLIRQLNVRISRADDKEIVKLVTQQPFRIHSGEAGATLDNPEGELAAVDISDFDLSWANPFSAPYELAGTLRRARFVLGAEQDALVARSTDVMQIVGLGVSDAGKPLLDAVSVGVRPAIVHLPGRTQVRYEGLRIAAAPGTLIAGNGAVGLASAEDGALTVEADGSARVELNRLPSQPLVRELLDGHVLDAPLATTFSYRLTHSPAATTIHALDLKVLHDDTPYVGLATTSGLALRPTLEPGENLARHAVGEMQLAVTGLTAAVLADFLPLGTVDFASIDAVLDLRSDGDKLYAESQQPLRIANVRLRDGDGAPLLRTFDLEAAAGLTAYGDMVAADVSAMSVTFAGATTPALAGSFAAMVEPGAVIPLKDLRADFSGDLPQLLEQPAVLPGHSLSQGTLGTELAVDRNGAITASTQLGNLVGKEALAIRTIEMPLTGNMRADGRGFDFSMPLVGNGRSGTSNAQITGQYLPTADAPALLSVRIDSELFYLNDILATVAGISADAKKKSGDKKSKAAEAAPAAPLALDETRDASAFWDLLPYDTRLGFAFAQVFYSDYVAFHTVDGSVDVRSDRLTLGEFGAYFHDSPITLDGGLSFHAERADPYSADFTGQIRDFDLNQFFTELAPTKKSRIEGLFGVDFALGGESPNASQFRNRLLIDLRMQSREGLFRPLPPDSPLMVGASDALGIIGEGLSYMPTGGFGAGAVSRLVDYIAEVDYDSIDVRIRRDETLDLNIERINLLSPEIRMAATGAIRHQPGKDIFDSPLEMTANLNMVGKGAAILYSIDLLEDEQDRFGYWKGPEVRISGSVTATESNFAEIVQRAADGSVKGGVTRPLAGLIGNIKHRWFGSDGDVRGAQLEGEDTTAPAAGAAEP